jgi:TonB family protein
MSSWVTGVGSDALVLFWWPVALWTVAGVAALAVLRFVPERFAREHYELRTVLLAALPVGLVVAAVVRAVAAEPLFVVALPYEIVVRANGTATREMIDLSSIAGVSTGSLVLAVGAGAAALFGLFRLAADLGALGRFRRTLRPVTDPDAVRLLRRAARENGIRGPVRLVTSTALGTPAAFGWLRPTVVVPESLVDRPGELRLVLLHETAHLARGDFALDALARMVRTLFGWHPLVRHLSRAHAYWREAACDLAVLTAPLVDRSAYARLLLAISTAGPLRVPALVATMAATPSQLTRRIEAMTRIQHPGLTLPAVRHALALVLLAGVVTFTACSDSTPAAVDPSTDQEAADAAKSPDVHATATVDRMPELVGGLKAVAESIVYPSIAKKAGIQGRVVVEFVVDESGAVRDAKVVSGIGAGCDEEAVRAVEAARFIPGMLDGNPVAVRMALPVSFKLQ